MAASFTPGPLRFWTVSIKARRWWISRETDRKPIASTDTEADARLFATAPELYEAAVKVLAGLNERIDLAAAAGQPVPVFAGIADLHDAITKAEGSQP